MKQEYQALLTAANVLFNKARYQRLWEEENPPEWAFQLQDVCQALEDEIDKEDARGIQKIVPGYNPTRYGSHARVDKSITARRGICDGDLFSEAMCIPF